MTSQTDRLLVHLNNCIRNIEPFQRTVLKDLNQKTFHIDIHKIENPDSRGTGVKNLHSSNATRQLLSYDMVKNSSETYL